MDLFCPRIKSIMCLVCLCFPRSIWTSWRTAAAAGKAPFWFCSATFVSIASIRWTGLSWQRVPAARQENYSSDRWCHVWPRTAEALSHLGDGAHSPRGFDVSRGENVNAPEWDWATHLCITCCVKCSETTHVVCVRPSGGTRARTHAYMHRNSLPSYTPVNISW